MTLTHTRSEISRNDGGACASGREDHKKKWASGLTGLWRGYRYRFQPSHRFVVGARAHSICVPSLALAVAAGYLFCCHSNNTHRYTTTHVHRARAHTYTTYIRDIAHPQHTLSSRSGFANVASIVVIAITVIFIFGGHWVIVHGVILWDGRAYRVKVIIHTDFAKVEIIRVP